VEETGQDLALVLRGEDPRQLHDDREAKPAVSNRLNDRGDASLMRISALP
jgi:hypothetical protein